MTVVLISKQCAGCDDAGIEVCNARRITAGDCYRGEVKTDNRCLRYDKSGDEICTICGVPHPLSQSYQPIDKKPLEGNVDGTAKAQAHYKGATLEPIEIMQEYLSQEAFQGFLYGNIIKYSLRYQRKGTPKQDLNKCSQYLKWLRQAMDGEKINPRE